MYIQQKAKAMGGKDLNFQVVYRGEKLERYNPGGWVFFQREKRYGGGYWFGRTYDDCFFLEFERPTSLSEGIKYLNALNSIGERWRDFDDDFKLMG